MTGIKMSSVDKSRTKHLSYRSRGLHNAEAEFRIFQ